MLCGFEVQIAQNSPIYFLTSLVLEVNHERFLQKLHGQCNKRIVGINHTKSQYLEYLNYVGILNLIQLQFLIEGDFLNAANKWE